jgi:hypothetical protein
MNKIEYWSELIKPLCVINLYEYYEKEKHAEISIFRYPVKRNILRYECGNDIIVSLNQTATNDINLCITLGVKKKTSSNELCERQIICYGISLTDLNRFLIGYNLHETLERLKDNIPFYYIFDYTFALGTMEVYIISGLNNLPNDCKDLLILSYYRKD